MSLRFVTLGVFTDKKFSGNPVAIVHVPDGTTLTQNQKQLIAREFNLSETVFLHEPNEKDKQNGDVRIGIFTAIAEVPFAGHPTVGTSNYLLRYLKDDPKLQGVRALQALAGRIPIDLSRNGKGIQLQVAHNVHVHHMPFKGTPFGHYPVVSIVKGMTFILAQLQSLQELAKTKQNLLGTENTYTSKHALDEGWQEGLITTYYYVDLGIVEDGTRKIRSRMFGSREDPATGSAASALCSSLALCQKGALITKYHITQGVEMGRQSDIFIQVTLEENFRTIKEVLLSGTAVKVMEGTIDIPES